MMGFGSFLRGIFWRLLDILLRAPTLIGVLLLGVILAYMMITHPYMFREPAYISKDIAETQDLKVDILLPDHLKAGATPMPLYMSLAFTTTAQQPVVIHLDSPDKLVKIVPSQKTFQVGSASSVYSETQLSIQYVDGRPSLFSDHTFTLTTEIEINGVRENGEPVSLSVDSLTVRIMAALVVAGLIVAFILSVRKLFSNKPD